MNVSPFLLLKQSAAQTVSQRAEAALARWESDWCVLPARRIQCLPLESARQTPCGLDRWHAHRLANGAAAWHRISGDMRRDLRRALCHAAALDDPDGDSPDSALVSDLVGDAVDALAACLLDEISGFPSREAVSGEPADRLFRHGAGTALCSVGTQNGSLELLLPADALPQTALRNGAAPRPTLTPLCEALRDIRVTLAVELSRPDLTLGYLDTLAVGDVLILPSTVDQPLHVLAPGQVPVCEAHIGAVDGKRAVELIKPLH